MDPQLEKLLTPFEVAHLLGIKKSTLYQAVQDGRLPAIRLWRGKRRSLLRFRVDEINEFIASRSTLEE